MKHKENGECKKEVCKNCGDNIIGEKYRVNFVYNRYWYMIVDFGCLLLLQRKGVIRSYKKIIYGE